MKATNLASIKRLKKPHFWLLAIAAGLVAINLTLTWRAGDVAHLGMSILFWAAVASLLWDKRQSLSFETNLFSRILGALLLAGMLLANASQTDEHILRVFPFICALELGILASGFRGLKQYWQELTILFFLGVPSVLLSTPLTDISPITARFSAFILWYSGFAVTRQGVYVSLPKGTIEVYAGCSGIEAMTYLLGLGVIFVVMFPTNLTQKIIVPIVGVALGFVVNGFRVALMAVLVASSNPKAFEYWHEGDGSLIFGMISVLLFGFFCLLLLQQTEPKNQDTTDF